MIVTREWITNYIKTQPKEKVGNMIGRALVCLYNRQTEQERALGATKNLNGAGFTAYDADLGTRTAKTFLKSGRLLDWQVRAWTKENKRGIPKIAKYYRQLDEEAQKKAGTP